MAFQWLCNGALDYIDTKVNTRVVVLILIVSEVEHLEYEAIVRFLTT